MNDDWSLKDKEGDTEEDGKCYLVQYIETLRQKLIEEFEFNYFAFERCDNREQFMNNVTYIINKRFGVEK